MKRLLIVAVLLLFMMAPITVCAEAVGPSIQEGVVTEADAKPEWQVLIEEKVVPYLIFGLTCIGTVYIAISPVLAKMRRASDKYSTSADGVNTVSASSKESTAEVKALREEIKALRAEMAEKEAKDHELLATGVRMMAIAFSHESELVKNGAASAIMKLAGEEQNGNE